MSCVTLKVIDHIIIVTVKFNKLQPKHCMAAVEYKKNPGMAGHQYNNPYLYC